MAIGTHQDEVPIISLADFRIVDLDDFQRNATGLRRAGNIGNVRRTRPKPQQYKAAAEQI